MELTLPVQKGRVSTTSTLKKKKKLLLYLYPAVLLTESRKSNFLQYDLKEPSDLN